MNQDTAFAILKTGISVFLTGEPGAGKTYTINRYIKYLRSHGIDPAITAATGIAATHIGGRTIHSWSGIGIQESLDKHALHEIVTSKYIAPRIEKATVLIIDEISMLSAAMLDMVELVCRKVKNNQQPFGGMQVVLVGDFFQLPPIFQSEITGEDRPPQSRFAYEAAAWKEARLAVCYLTEQYRQDDDEYSALLSAVRSNSCGDKERGALLLRKVKADELSAQITKLYTHNVDVDRVNARLLADLPGPEKLYLAKEAGRPRAIEALRRGCLSPSELRLKVGAKVMFTKNNQRSEYVNGTIGRVVGFTGDGKPKVETNTGRVIAVEPVDWELAEDGQVVATFTQLPLRLAWAITVHKSQGLSLDEAIMDLSQVFAFGQGYVALSRVRRLSGLYILGLNTRALEVHPEALTQDEKFKKLADIAESEWKKYTTSDLELMEQEFLVNAGGVLSDVPAKPRVTPKVFKSKKKKKIASKRKS